MNIQTFLKTPGTIIDVRTPGEFIKGHIPGALNIPLLSNEERVLVGTVYKQKGRDEAVLLGLKIVGPKLATFVEEAKSLVKADRVKIYCWRGGMRSQSMAWLLQTGGMQTSTLHEGYKAYRQWVLQTIGEQRSIRLIGGLTGSGKTELLQKLSLQGEQVLDLEDLAQHSGSSYGGLNSFQQPTQEQFENEIAQCWQTFSSERPVWVEDESRMIGKCKIPDSLFAQMRDAPLFVIESNQEMRINQLLKNYGKASISQLIDATKRIERKLGIERTQKVISHLQNQNFTSAIEIILDYYDKMYTDSLKKRHQPIIYLQNNVDANACVLKKLNTIYTNTVSSNYKN